MTQVLEPEAEAARARFLARGECRHGHTLTPEGVYVRRDGLVECRACMADASRRHRERHKKPQRRAPEAPPVSCLRCPLARLLPETDMSQPRPRIHCQAFNAARPLCLEPCLRAEGEKLKPTLQRSDVEVAFVVAHYRTHGPRRLAVLTQRDESSTRRVATSRGIFCPPELRLQVASEGRRRLNRQRGHGLNDAQRKAYERAVEEGRYPPIGGITRGRGAEEALKKRAAMRTALLEELRALGPVASWDVVLWHHSNNSPSALRRKREHKQAAEAQTRAGA